MRLYGALRRYRPQDAPDAGAFPLELPEGTTVAGVLERLGAPVDWARSAFVNEEPSGKDRVLRPGDQLALFPPAGGGSRSGTCSLREDWKPSARSSGYDETGRGR